MNKCETKIIFMKLQCTSTYFCSFMTWKYTCRTGKFKYFWLNIISFLFLYRKHPPSPFHVDFTRFMEITLVSNISILQNRKGDALSLKNRMKKGKLHQSKHQEVLKSTASFLVCCILYHDTLVSEGQVN